MENITEENIRIIFGIKVKKLRLDKTLSLHQLSALSGISVSYLNEIENGKKYPKPDKINQLSKTLDISYDQLVSSKLSKSLAPVGQFLNFEVINDFLFETFGIDKGTLLTMVANEPIKVSAFINSIFEIARNYNLKQEHFFFSCLRSYQELNDNYFDDIEDAVLNFIKQNSFDIKHPIAIASYEAILKENYNYTIQATDWAAYPKIKHLRSVTIKGNRPRLLYNKKLTDRQRAFLLGREIGFSYLKIDKRPYTTSWMQVESFDQVLKNFRASYFAQALHIHREHLIQDIESFFGNATFNTDTLVHLLDKYEASPEMLLTRISNILPRYFGTSELFFIRYSSREPERNLKEISKELHLSKHSANLEYSTTEQNYRRWLTKSLLKYMLEKKGTDKTKVEAVLSQNSNGNEYLTISILRQMPELNDNNNSVTLGFTITDTLRKKIHFLNDKALHISKLGLLNPSEFEPQAELKIIKEQQERMAELERLMRNG